MLENLNGWMDVSIIDLLNTLDDLLLILDKKHKLPNSSVGSERLALCS